MAVSGGDTGISQALRRDVVRAGSHPVAELCEPDPFGLKPHCACPAWRAAGWLRRVQPNLFAELDCVGRTGVEITHGPYPGARPIKSQISDSDRTQCRRWHVTPAMTLICLRFLIVARIAVARRGACYSPLETSSTLLAALVVALAGSDSAAKSRGSSRTTTIKEY